MNDINDIDCEPKWKRGWLAHLAPSDSTETFEGVLRYLRDTAGFDIRVKPNVPMRDSRYRRVGRAENVDQALTLLSQVAADMHCAVLRKGRSLTVLTSQDAKKECVPLPTVVE